LRQFLTGRSELAFIDAEAIMNREKPRSSEHLYYKADMHVTEVTQIAVVKEIVAQAARAENRLDLRWDENLKLSHVRINSGSQARFMALLTPPEEEAPYYAGSHTIGATELDGHWN